MVECIKHIHSLNPPIIRVFSPGSITLVYLLFSFSLSRGSFEVGQKEAGGLHHPQLGGRPGPIMFIEIEIYQYFIF